MITGKPDALDRLVQILILIAALVALANGMFMLVRPLDWYVFIPGVITTGPPNQHFIRDIALAYLGSGLILLYATINPPLRWMAAMVGGLWLSFHGALHIYEVAAGICGPAVFWADSPGVLGPPLMIWIAIGILFARRRIAPAGLPKSVLLAIFDKTSPGENGWYHEVARAPGHAFEKFVNFMPATLHRHDAPVDLFHAARIGATLVEDCGPCAITAANGALADGLSRDIVNQLLSSRPPAELAQAFAFGQAIAAQSAEALELGDQIEAGHGRIVRLELAMTAAMVRAYPAIKRGLGLTKSCALAPLTV